MSSEKKGNVGKGLALALLSIPVAIVGWLLLWQIGVIASVVPFVSALAAVWLYKKGAGTDNTRPGAIGLISIVVVGALLAFLSGMVADAWVAYTGEFKDVTSLLDSGFVNFFTSSIITSSEIWSEYTTDLIFSVVFAIIGAGGVVADLFKPADKKTKKPAKK